MICSHLVHRLWTAKSAYETTSYWIGETKPCLTYGLRGMAAFSVSVECCEQDLHSGVMGGSVHEVGIFVHNND